MTDQHDKCAAEVRAEIDSCLRAEYPWLKGRIAAIIARHFPQEMLAVVRAAAKLSTLTQGLHGRDYMVARNQLLDALADFEAKGRETTP